MRGCHISKCYDHSLMVCDAIIVRWIGTVSEEPTGCTLKMHAAVFNETLVMNKWTSLC
jgi:hypothetical protein